MHLPQFGAILLYNDNESTRTLATKYSGSHKRVRYILLKINWLMEMSKEQVVKFLHLDAAKLPADLGAKLHTGSAYRQ